MAGLSPEEVANFRGKLLVKAANLMVAVTGAQEEMREPSDTVRGDWIDQADSVQVQMVIERLKNGRRDQLTTVLIALKRIDQGRYGVCDNKSCKQPIAPSRLKAVPEALQCAPCKGQLEQQRQSSSPDDEEGEETPVHRPRRARLPVKRDRRRRPPVVRWRK